MWEGGECWIIGGGPSLPRQFGVPDDIIHKVMEREMPISAYSPYFFPIHNKHVIGVNVAFLLGDWVDIAFFGDGGFYFNNRKELLEFPNLRISCNPNVTKKKFKGVKYVPRDHQHPYGLTRRKSHVSWNGNSGAAAINLAYHLGVKRIYLLGFDMGLQEGLQHWHKHYPKAQKNKKPIERKLPFHRHKKGFPQIAKDARKAGMEIINVSPDSELDCFKKCSIKDIIG